MSNLIFECYHFEFSFLHLTLHLEFHIWHLTLGVVKLNPQFSIDPLLLFDLPFKLLYLRFPLLELEPELLFLAYVYVQHFLVLSHQLVPMKFDFVLKLESSQFVVPCFYHHRELLLIIDYRDVASRLTWELRISLCISRVWGFVCLNERIAMQRFVFKRLVWWSIFRKWDRMRILLSAFFRILIWILRWSSSVKFLFCSLNVNLDFLIAYEWFKTGCWRALINNLRNYLLLFVSVQLILQISIPLLHLLHEYFMLDLHIVRVDLLALNHSL